MNELQYVNEVGFVLNMLDMYAPGWSDGMRGDLMHSGTPWSVALEGANEVSLTYGKAMTDDGSAPEWESVLGETSKQILRYHDRRRVWRIAVHRYFADRDR